HFIKRVFDRAVELCQKGMSPANAAGNAIIEIQQTDALAISRIVRPHAERLARQFDQPCPDDLIQDIISDKKIRRNIRDRYVPPATTDVAQQSLHLRNYLGTILNRKVWHRVYGNDATRLIYMSSVTDAMAGSYSLRSEWEDREALDHVYRLAYRQREDIHRLYTILTSDSMNDASDRLAIETATLRRWFLRFQERVRGLIR